MEYQAVTSSTVTEIGYDADTNTLAVRYLNGGEYHYHGVPEDVFDGLRTASSIGRYLDQCVKKAGYPYTRVG